MVREDVYDEWGWPGTTKHEEWEQVELSDVMLLAREVPQEAWLDEQEFPVTWTADTADHDRETSAVQPVEDESVIDVSPLDAVESESSADNGHYVNPEGEDEDGSKSSDYDDF